MAVKVLELNKDVMEENDRTADEVREKMRRDHTFMINLMASPGAGKTSVLLETVRRLKPDYAIGVMEADIEATVDAEKMEEAGVRSIEVHTGGECAMNAEMTKRAVEEFHTEDLDILFMENIGNLVCPAEEDTGAARNVAILSVPEGDDKPLKYPLMFQVCQAVIINKIDTKPYFAFDDEKAAERIRRRNPEAEIFFVSAKTGEGMDDWTAWVRREAERWISCV